MASAGTIVAGVFFALVLVATIGVIAWVVVEHFKGASDKAGTSQVGASAVRLQGGSAVFPYFPERANAPKGVSIGHTDQLEGLKQKVRYADPFAARSPQDQLISYTKRPSNRKADANRTVEDVLQADDIEDLDIKRDLFPDMPKKAVFANGDEIEIPEMYDPTKLKLQQAMTGGMGGFLISESDYVPQVKQANPFNPLEAHLKSETEYVYNGPGMKDSRQQKIEALLDDYNTEADGFGVLLSGTADQQDRMETEISMADEEQAHRAMVIIHAAFEEAENRGGLAHKYLSRAQEDAVLKWYSDKNADRKTQDVAEAIARRFDLLSQRYRHDMATF